MTGREALKSSMTGIHHRTATEIQFDLAHLSKSGRDAASVSVIGFP